MTVREKSSMAFTTAALMVGLGTFMILLCFKFLPSVWVAYNRVEVGCQIIESSIREDVEKGTFQILLNLRWKVGELEYGTSKTELWREKPQKSSSLDYLLVTYQEGNSVSGYYDEGYPAKVFPEKARASELWWLIILGIIAVSLIGVGLIRFKRHIRRPKRHTVTVREGVTYDYIPKTTQEMSAITPAIIVWRPVFEALGLDRPDEDAFRYSGTIDGVSIHIFLSEINEETKVLGYQRPPLTIRFDHPEGNREVFFWVRHRRRDDPIQKDRNFWATFDTELDLNIEVTGYDEKIVAAMLDAHGRRLLRELVVEHQITIYAGQQKSVDLDTMSIADPAEGIAILRHWIAWMSHIFSAEKTIEERLASTAMSDPDELVRIHRLCLLLKHFPESDVTSQVLSQIAGGDDGALCWLAKALRGEDAHSLKAGHAVAKHIEAFWGADRFSLLLALRYLQQLMDVLPEALDGAVIEGALASDNHALVEEVIKLVERRKELTPQCEGALIKRLDECAYPIAMRCIHLLGHRGTLRAVEAITPYTLGEYRLTDLAEAAHAAIEKIKYREELEPLSDDEP